MFPCPSKMFSLFLSYLHLLSIGITDTHCWDLLFTWYWGSDSDPTLLWQAFYPLAIFSTSRPFPVLPILPSGIMPEYNARSITTPIKPWASASQRLKDFMKWAVGTGREHLFEADLLQLNYKHVSLFNYLHGVRADFKSIFFPSSFITILSVLVTHQVLALRQCPPWPPGVGKAAAVSSGAWQWHPGTGVPELACHHLCLQTFIHTRIPAPPLPVQLPHLWQEISTQLD